MEKGFILLREYIYGLDFTEWDGDENIIIHNTEKGVQAEIDYEREYDPNSDDLSIGNAHVEDGYVIVTNDSGRIITKSEERDSYVFDD